MEAAFSRFRRTNFGIDLRNYDNTTVNTLKQYILNKRKYINTIERKQFLLKSRRHGVYPEFIRQKTTKFFKDILNAEPKFRSSTIKLSNNLMKQYLNLEIKMCINKLNNVDKICKMEYNLILSALHVSDTQKYFFCLSFYQRQHILNTNKRLEKKFNNINKTEENFETTHLNNLSNKIIPKDIAIILSLGPTFAPPNDNTRCPALKLVSEVEDIFTTYLDRGLIQEDRTMIARTINNHLNSNSHLSPIEKYLYNAFKNTKQFLKNNQDIMVLNSDKSNKSVIMNKTEYIQKMNILLSDTTTYEKIKIDPTNKTNNLCLKKVSKTFMNKSLPFTHLHKLVTHNPITPRMYGLPKLHKTNIPLRPIVSTINSPVYKMSKYLINSIKTLTQNSKFNVKNSYDFKSKIDTITLQPNDILVSFDVISLFTNIPVDIAISEIDKRWDEIKHNTDITDKEAFMDLLKFCIKDNNFFKFQNIFYKQKKGLAMGNPLSPILADIVLELLFNNTLKKLNFNPTFLYKYVDDIILAIPETHIQILHTELEKFHKDLKFTIEKENNNTINFLDMTLIRQNNKIITKWYSKPSASNRMLNYHSAHPKKMKVNVINSFIRRIFNLSHPQFKFENIDTIYKILKMNNYPIHLIKNLIHQHFNPVSHQNQNIQNNTDTNPQYTYKSLSFIPELTNKIIKIIKRNNSNVKIANKIPFKAQSLYSKLKDPIDLEKSENVIYCIPCGGIKREDEEISCNLKYYGHTQLLSRRIKQHKYNEKNRDRNPKESGLVYHSHDTRHKFDFDNTIIIDQAKNKKQRETLEAGYIWMNCNQSVNFRSDMQKVNFIYSKLIKTIKNIHQQ